MAKATKLTKATKPTTQPEEVDKSTLIKSLLEEYSKLTKKSNGEGRRIRRKLRRLDYYLSKQSKTKELNKK